MVDCDERKEFELELISKEDCAKYMVAKERKVEEKGKTEQEKKQEKKQEKQVNSAEMLQSERGKIAQQLHEERMKNIKEEKQTRIEFAKKYYQYSMRPEFLTGDKKRRIEYGRRVLRKKKKRVFAQRKVGHVKKKRQVDLPCSKK